MRKFLQWLREFLSQDDGVSVVEWALLVALVVIVCLIAIVSIGEGSFGTFSGLAINVNWTGQ